MVTIKILPTDHERGNPSGKLADVELQFHDDPAGSAQSDTVLHGLKLIGFSI